LEYRARFESWPRLIFQPALPIRGSAYSPSAVTIEHCSSPYCERAINGSQRKHCIDQRQIDIGLWGNGAVAELVGIEVGVVSGVMNLESSGVEASDWRLRHEQAYHEACFPAACD
jgi:hypothetical protein